MCLLFPLFGTIQFNSIQFIVLRPHSNRANPVPKRVRNPVRHVEIYVEIVPAKDNSGGSAE